MNDAKPRRRGRRPGTYVDEDDGDRRSVLGAYSYFLLYRRLAGGKATEGQWPPIGGEGVFTWAIATVFLPDIIHSNSPHGPIRELHRDDEIPNQIKSIRVLINWQSITLTQERHNASRWIVCTKNEAGTRLDSIRIPCRQSHLTCLEG
jgi:hypothetical protein